MRPAHALCNSSKLNGVGAVTVVVGVGEAAPVGSGSHGGAARAMRPRLRRPLQQSVPGQAHLPAAGKPQKAMVCPPDL